MTEDDDRYAVLSKLGDEKNLLLGVLAGVVEALITQPLTYLKNCLQQRLSLQFDPRLWWRGSYAACTCDGTLIGFQFMACGFLQKQMLLGEKRQLTMSEEMISALVAGAASGLPCSFLEMTMIQQQRFGGSPLATILRLKSIYGYRIFLRGLGPSAGREAIFAAGYLGLSPQIERFFEKTTTNTKLHQTFACLTSGILCAFLTHPLDTIKSCMQGDLERRTYHGFRHTYLTIADQGAKQAGFSSFASPSHLRIVHTPSRALASASPFFRGFGARAAIIVLCFNIFTECKLAFAHLLFPEVFSPRPLS